MLQPSVHCQLPLVPPGPLKEEVFIVLRNRAKLDKNPFGPCAQTSDIAEQQYIRVLPAAYGPCSATWRCCDGLCRNV